MSSAESNASGMLYCRADSCAFSRVRRDRAVTRQFCASAKPGIRRFTACNPNPRMPNRIKREPCGAGALEPRPLNLVLYLSQAENAATTAFVGLNIRARAPAPRHTATHITPTHFANTTACGARFVVAAIVLLGSPPVSWLIW